jgi:NAD(P)-dependent dehydrogenase (short-subunit alcohol dehydrogenase family)
VISQQGGRANAQYLDVSDEKQVTKLVSDTVAAYQRLDFMFNHAGINVLGDARDLRLEDWHHVIDINLWGTIYGMIAAYTTMARQGYGHIVNTSSLSGLLPGPTVLPYSTTKHAIVGLSLGWRAEAAGLGIRVSVACPGFVQTGLQKSATVVNAPHDQVMAQTTPFKKMEAAQAARTILRGVVRNEAVIVFPSYARIAWWLYRINPMLLNRLQTKMIQNIRSLRIQD